MNDGTRVVHVKDKVPGAIYIGRAVNRLGLSGSPFANPYVIGEHGDRQRVLWYYSDDLYKYRHKPGDLMHRLPDLRGKPLACWCRHDAEEISADNRCHGDILIDALERYSDEELLAFGRPKGMPQLDSDIIHLNIDGQLTPERIDLLNKLATAAKRHMDEHPRYPAEEV